MRASSAQLLARGQAMPRSVEPMLAVLSDLPCDEPNHAFEFKWDGVRAVAYWDGRELELQSRNRLDITPRYPELHALGKALGRDRRVILDGEVVALDEADRPSFARLQKRMHVRDGRAVMRLMRDVPVYYILFDILYLDGESLMDRPWTERRAALEQLTLQGANWRVSPVVVGEGDALYEAARTNRMEGIMAKRLDSVYEPGRRSPHWRKVKVVMGQEFVIGGWVPEGGTNRNRIGSLLLGYYDGTGRNKVLRYAGGVGTGFDAEWHRKLVSLLTPLERKQNPFDGKTDKPQAVFVDPVLVADVEYRRWPEGGKVQQGAFKGLRTDKKAQSVVKELICAP